MRIEQLLKELESVTHDGRMRRMVDLGRRAVGDAAAAGALEALERGGFYERRLALQACQGSRDGARVLRAVTDASRGIRGLALTMVPLLCDDGQVAAALEAVSFRQRQVLLRRLHQRRRFVPIDAFLDRLAAGKDEQLVRLLPFGSPAAVGRHVEPVLDRAGQADWRRLARLHPTLAGELLERRAAAVERLDPRLVWQANAALPLLADSVPDQALAVVRALLRTVSLSQLELQRLSERRPSEVADLVLTSDDQARVRFDGVVGRLDSGRLRALVAQRSAALGAVGLWLDRLPPAERAAQYADCERGWRDGAGCLPAEIVALLPSETREREGRRHLGLAALATRPEQRMAYAAFLPWDEARAGVDPYLGHPEAELRAAALTALVSATRYHRDRAPELLALVHARRNEQDPVRLAMLAGLASLPPGMRRAEHLDELSRIPRAAGMRIGWPGCALTGRMLLPSSRRRRSSRFPRRKKGRKRSANLREWDGAEEAGGSDPLICANLREWGRGLADRFPRRQRRGGVHSAGGGSMTDSARQAAVIARPATAE